MKVNLNNNIKVKLTSAAKTYLANRHARLFGKYPNLVYLKKMKKVTQSGSYGIL